MKFRGRGETLVSKYFPSICIYNKNAGKHVDTDIIRLHHSLELVQSLWPQAYEYTKVQTGCSLSLLQLKIASGNFQDLKVIAA